VRAKKGHSTPKESAKGSNLKSARDIKLKSFLHIRGFFNYLLLFGQFMPRWGLLFLPFDGRLRIGQ
jgi:hypothetical protein